MGGYWFFFFFFSLVSFSALGSVLTTEVGRRIRFYCILVFYFKDFLVWHCTIKCFGPVLCCQWMSSVNSGSWSKISWEALHCDCLHNVHQTLVFWKGQRKSCYPWYEPFNSTPLCIFLSVLLCLVHWMAIIWTPLCHSHTHCIILLTWLRCQEHPTLSGSLFSFSSSFTLSRHLWSLHYVLSSAQRKNLSSIICLFMGVYF